MCQGITFYMRHSILFDHNNMIPLPAFFPYRHIRIPFPLSHQGFLGVTRHKMADCLINHTYKELQDFFVALIRTVHAPSS